MKFVTFLSLSATFVSSVVLAFVLGVAGVKFCPVLASLSTVGNCPTKDCCPTGCCGVTTCPCGEADCTCNDKCPCTSKECIKNKRGCCVKK